MRRTSGVVVVFAAIAALLAYLLVVYGREPATPSAQALAAKVEDFTSAAQTFTFEGTGETTTVLSEVPPRSRAVRFATMGAEAPEQLRYVNTYDDRTLEYVRDTGRAVYRVAPTPGQLGGVKWQVDRVKKGN